MDRQILDGIDELVAAGRFASRSQAVEEAVGEMLRRARRSRLARECQKLDASEERCLAEVGLGVAESPA